MAEAKIIDGKQIAAELRGRVAAAVAWLKQQHGITPGLAVVLVGEDPASQVYVGSKAKQTVEAGMQSFEHRLPAETGEAELLALVARLNADDAVDGILVQLPLPKHIDATKVLEAIDPAKGRGWLSSGQLRAAGGGAARAGGLHATRLRHPGQDRGAVVERHGGRRGGPFEHRRQAGGAAPAARGLHRHHRAFAHTRPAGRSAPRGSR